MVSLYKKLTKVATLLQFVTVLLPALVIADDYSSDVNKITGFMGLYDVM